MMMGEWGARWVRSWLEPRRPRRDPADVGHAPHGPASSTSPGTASWSASSSATCRGTSGAGASERGGRGGPVRDRPGLRRRSRNSGRSAHHDRDLDRRCLAASRARLGRARGAWSGRSAPPAEPLARSQRVRPDQRTCGRRCLPSERTPYVAGRQRQAALARSGQAGSGRARPGSVKPRKSCGSRARRRLPHGLPRRETRA